MGKPPDKEVSNETVFRGPRAFRPFLRLGPEHGFDPEEPGIYEIAQIASTFLPKISPPVGWESIHPADLMDILHPRVEGGNERSATFNVLAGEAVRRAEILIAFSKAAIAREFKARNRALIEREEERIEAMVERSERGKRQREQEEVWGSKFDRFARKIDHEYLSLPEVLGLILQGSTPSLRMLYWREWIRSLYDEGGTSFIFFDEPNPNGTEHIIATDERDRHFTREQFVRRAPKVKAFYAKYGEALRNKRKAADPVSRNAGKKGAKAKEKKTLAEAGKYGGSDSPDLAKIVKQAKSKKPRTSKRKSAKKSKK